MSYSQLVISDPSLSNKPVLFRVYPPPPPPSAITVLHFFPCANKYLPTPPRCLRVLLAGAERYPHQKTQSILSAPPPTSLSLGLSLSLFSSPSLFLVSVHSGSHFVFLILFYISSRTLSLSLSLSLSLPPIHGSTTNTQKHFFFLKAV